MSGTMPFHLEKGPYLALLESFCNTDQARLTKALTKLRDPNVPIPELGPFDSTNLRGPLSPTVLKECMYRDWFGFTFDQQTGRWSSTQMQYDARWHPTTGFWYQYYGDVEKILRETFTRAAEVSLGLDHDAEAPAAGAPRHWPIEFFWKCGQPWWEGWVTWRREADGRGQVTVILATPSTGDPVLRDPTTGRHSADYALSPSGTRQPSSTERTQGMWVITHKNHEERVVLSTTPSGSGDWPLPTLGVAYHGVDGVVVVQPSFADGGTQLGGYPYVQPTPP